MASGRSARYGLRAVAVCYVAVLVVVPVAVVAWRTVAQGGAQLWSSLSSAQAVEAFRLTGIVAGSAVVCNVVFGLGLALLLTRYRFPGKRVLNLIVDLPVSVSPIVVGLALVLVYGPRGGWLGGWLAGHGIQIIYAVPGMVLATTFVALPLVIRELVPVLQQVGLEQEQAAQVLGASGLQRLWRITLPTVKWALAYGIVLSLARSIGEFGAVQVVSGNVSGSGQTQTATLLVHERVQQLTPGAYQISIVLIALAVGAIVTVSLTRPEENA